MYPRLALAGGCVLRRLPVLVVVFCGTGLTKRSPDQNGRGLNFSWKLRHFEEAITTVSDFIVLWELLSNFLDVFVYFG